METARVTRATNGDYRVMVGTRLISNHGRRRAEAYAKADRVNEKETK